MWVLHGHARLLISANTPLASVITEYSKRIGRYYFSVTKGDDTIWIGGGHMPSTTQGLNNVFSHPHTCPKNQTDSKFSLFVFFALHFSLIKPLLISLPLPSLPLPLLSCRPLPRPVWSSVFVLSFLACAVCLFWSVLSRPGLFCPVLACLPSLPSLRWPSL